MTPSPPDRPSSPSNSPAAAGAPPAPAGKFPRGSGASIRWWPAALVLVAAAVAWLGAVTFAEDLDGQSRFGRQAAIVGAAVFALLVWLLLGSRLPWRRRLATFGGVVALAVALGAAVEIRGVDGDVVPILAWRFSPRPAAAVDLPPPTATATSAVPTPAAGAASLGDEAAGLAVSTVARPEGSPAVETADAGAPGSPAPAGSAAATAVAAVAENGRAEGVTDGSSGTSPEGAEAAAAAAEDGPAPGAMPAPIEAPGRSLDPATAARVAGPPGAADFPQFLGPQRNGTVPGIALARDWAAHPPREVWRRPVGPGWSAFAVAGGLAVTQEQDGEMERITAYELATGVARWSHASPGRYETTIAGTGPRATPSIVGDVVYAVGAQGRVTALELATGALRWSRDLGADTGAVTPEWGRSTSPLVVGGLVIVNAGGPDGKALVAYDAASGAPRWTGGDDRPSYSSPVLATLGGVEQVVVFGHSRLTGHDLETGAPLWTHPVSNQQPNVAMPLVLGGERVLISTGYGVGSELLEIIRAADGSWSASSLWRSPRLKAKFANPVLWRGRVLGLDDGTLGCLDPTTGERCFRASRYGHGQLLLVGDLLLVTAENGEVALVEPAADGARELGRFRAFPTKTWNPPALAGRYLLVRNDREAACYELALDEGDGASRGR
jgi:outer membrane protein assembly factor BamB